MKSISLISILMTYQCGVEAFSSTLMTPYELRILTTPLFLGNIPNHGDDEQPAINLEANIQQVDEKDGTELLRANRWSKHAPDANLPTEQFKNQLKENMKGELESRRASLPNRGNQPAKHYLDSL